MNPFQWFLRVSPSRRVEVSVPDRCGVRERPPDTEVVVLSGRSRSDKGGSGRRRPPHFLPEESGRTRVTVSRLILRLRLVRSFDEKDSGWEVRVRMHLWRIRITTFVSGRGGKSRMENGSKCHERWGEWRREGDIERVGKMSDSDKETRWCGMGSEETTTLPSLVSTHHGWHHKDWMVGWGRWNHGYGRRGNMKY